MSNLPAIIHRVPMAFYVAAAVMFVFSLWLTWSELHASYAYAEPGNPTYRLGMLRGVYSAAHEAICLVANGAIVQVLLAIWTRTPRGSEQVRGDQ